MAIDLAKYIPPNNYEHRRDFTNHHLIDQLDALQKRQLESRLLSLLEKEEDVDILVVETLAYLRSTDSIPLLMKVLQTSSNIDVVVVAVSIFEINGDKRMIDIALNAFKTVNGVFELFYYLKRFADPKVDDLIRSYINDADLLVSYNAKRALGSTLN